MQPVVEPVPKRPKDLPAGYHVAHFSEMLNFVGSVYAHVLAPVHRKWLTDFGSLHPAAQSLFVRIANRKSVVFRTEHLRYEDVDDRDRRLGDLHRAGFTSRLEPLDFADALGALPKDDLFALLTETDDSIRKSWTRPRLMTLARERLRFEECFAGSRGEAFIVQRRVHELRFLLYLYFGRIEESLTRFALRDLGLVRTHKFRTEFEARFETLEEAETSFFYADHHARLPSMDAAAIAALAQDALHWTASEADKRDALLFELGRRVEKSGDTETARGLFERGGSAECGERAIRLAYAAGDKDIARARLEAMIDNPASDGEALFAADFHARKFGGKRTSAITDMLRAAGTIKLDESNRTTPERGAIRHYERQGWTVHHAENTPWRTLFGLLFWEQLYGGGTATLHNEFERMPRALKSGTFYADHAEAIEARLAVLDDPDKALTALLKTFTAEHGAPNAVFRWRNDAIDLLRPLLNAPMGALATILREMAKDYPNRKDGFPDLMMTRDGALRLIEIKTENDQIRRNQLMQLLLLKRAGFDVAVNRVEWILDPDQIYVVVDIETTGGRANSHRITEIGAVKMQGGEIIDRWQSLINPQRPIPKFITGLTGISDDMVADAPVFAEVADSFADFMTDGIFVAHNVRFDYGFIAAEYARLDQRFRHPQLCTCQSMRALYKGLPSYGLAKLCHEFDIPLDSHHRAMCDAEAAAELLLLVNAKRTENAALASG